jgi:chromosome segregation ATPase
VRDSATPSTSSAPSQNATVAPETIQTALDALAGKLSGRRTKLSEIRDRLTRLSSDLRQVESERGRLVNQDTLLHYEEIARLENTAYSLRRSIALDEQAARECEGEIAQLDRDVSKTQSKTPTPSSPQARKAVRPEVRELWQKLADPDDPQQLLAAAAEHRQDIERLESRASARIRANVQGLAGQGSFDLSPGGSQTVTERSLALLQDTLSWADPQRRKQRAR